MKNVTETRWAVRTTWDNGNTFTRHKGYLLDFALTMGGTLAMYGLGRLVGKGVDHTPYLQEWFPQSIKLVSGLDVSGHVDGLLALLCGGYGFAKSGLSLNDKTLELEGISLAGIRVTYPRK